MLSRIDLFLLLMMVVCLYSAIMGGAPEKRVVVIFIVGFVASIITTTPSDEMYMHPEVGVLVVDLAMLAGFVALALSAERYWTLWICSMQVVQVMSHIPKTIIPELLPQAYYVIVAFWAYPMLIVLTIGTYRHQQRLRLYGADRSWSDFSALQR